MCIKGADWLSLLLSLSETSNGFINNAHYPNAIFPARVTDHIHEFFNVIDHVVQDVQTNACGQYQNDPDAGDDSGHGEEGQVDQASDNSNAETKI